MTERKSSRARKAVKYAGFDDESDDDFADAKPSKTKKQKVIEDDGIKSLKEKQAENSTRDQLPSEEPNSIRKRKSSTDKVYERELEEALQLSKLETSGSQDHCETKSKPDTEPTNTSTTSTPTLANDVQVEVEFTYSKAPQLTRVKREDLLSEKEQVFNFDREPPPLLPLDVDPSAIGIVMDESIECAVDREKEESKVGLRQSRRTTKKPVIIDDDDDSGDESDFNPGNDVDSESNMVEEDDDTDLSPSDDDSDFDDHRKTKKGKENLKKSAAQESSSTKTRKSTPKSVRKSVEKDVPKVTARRKPQSTSSRVKNDATTHNPAHISSPVPSSTIVASGLSSKLKASVPLSTVSSTIKQTERISQSWKAPGPAVSEKNGSTSLIKSPSSGLRLGLSRNQRLKPLHSSIKMV